MGSFEKVPDEWVEALGEFDGCPRGSGVTGSAFVLHSMIMM